MTTSVTPSETETTTTKVFMKLFTLFRRHVISAFPKTFMKMPVQTAAMMLTGKEHQSVGVAAEHHHLIFPITVLTNSEKKRK